MPQVNTKSKKKWTFPISIQFKMTKNQQTTPEHQNFTTNQNNNRFQNLMKGHNLSFRKDHPETLGKYRIFMDRMRVLGLTEVCHLNRRKRTTQGLRDLRCWCLKPKSIQWTLFIKIYKKLQTKKTKVTLFSRTRIDE